MDEQQKELLDEMATETNYFKFETDNTYRLQIQNWKLEKKQVPEYNDDSKLVEKIEFSCEFVDDKGKVHEFTTLSVRFAQKIKPFIKDLDPVNGTIVQITKVGEKQSTNYLIKAV